MSSDIRFHSIHTICVREDAPFLQKLSLIKILYHLSILLLVVDKGPPHSGSSKHQSVPRTWEPCQHRPPGNGPISAQPISSLFLENGGHDLNV